MAVKNINQALNEYTKLLGKENVITDDMLLYEAQSATFKTTRNVLGILKPHTADHIQKVVRIAKRHKTPLYTISTGKNWGYGSRAPTADNCFILDLSRMNKIIDYNEELGYVTLEPGVTQKQLYDFLKRKKAPFNVSTTGSTPHSSIIGNICERGVGLGPYSFRSRYVSGLEVILPSGKCIHTGFGRFSNAKAAGIYPEGLGPSFTDIFIQSNLGIITKLTLFLAPTPLYTQFIDLYVSKEKDLPKFLTIVQKFNLFTNAKRSASFHNDLQIIASRTQYPWKTTGGKTPLPADVAVQLKQKYDIPYVWRGVIEIYGYTKPEVAAQVQHFKALTGRMKGIEISPLYTADALDNKPTNIGKSTYWRMKTKPPKVKNPDTDGCGNIRLSMAVPLTSKNISEVTETMKKTITEFGYEPFIEIHCIFERAALVVASLTFDRTIKGEDENALECHDTLLKQLMSGGYYPYRLNTHAMKLVPKSADDYDDFQKLVKQAIDPENILSPGRYEVLY